MSKYFIPYTLNILSVNLLSLDLPSEIFMSFVGSELIFCSKIGSKTISRQKKRPPRANPRRSENPLFMRFISDYSMIEATLPEPTVLPPSRIANVRPWLIAIGWMSSIVISTLSPGMHISVPAGRLHTPVTSVVLK